MIHLSPNLSYFALPFEYNSYFGLLTDFLPTIAIVLILFICFEKAYKIIRKRTSYSVNCWFCNGWIKVPYKNRNSFECTLCLQYNGFNKDGDYNKIIQEQFSVNKSATSSKKSNKIESNGLCLICNNNQQLRVQQLAKFRPMIEANYDKEIEHFEKQLNNAYKLCKQCEKHLNKTIRKQNTWVFTKRIRDSLFNRSVPQEKSTKNGTFLINTLKVAVKLVLFEYSVFSTFSIAQKLPENCVFLTQLNEQFAKDLFVFLSFDLNVPILLAIFGVLLQIISIVFVGKRSLDKNGVFCLLLWTMLAVSSTLKLGHDYNCLILFIQLFFYGLSFEQQRPTINKNPVKKRDFIGATQHSNTNDLDYDDDDDDDDDDADVELLFYEKHASKRNSHQSKPPDTEINQSMNNLRLGRHHSNNHQSTTAAARKLLTPPRFHPSSSLLMSSSASQSSESSGFNDYEYAAPKRAPPPTSPPSMYREECGAFSIVSQPAAFHHHQSSHYLVDNHSKTNARVNCFCTGACYVNSKQQSNAAQNPFFMQNLNNSTFIGT